MEIVFDIKRICISFYQLLYQSQHFLFPYSKMSYLEFSEFTTNIQITSYKLNEEEKSHLMRSLIRFDNFQSPLIVNLTLIVVVAEY